MADYGLQIWKYLISNGCTKAGAAGILGNMKHESGVIPNKVEILCLRRIQEYYGENYDDASYTAAVDGGKISRAEFLNPLPDRQYGYGLCQWTSPNRKAGLYDLCKEKRTSISDIECQLSWLMSELKKTYPNVWNKVSTSEDIDGCADIVLREFENPDNPGLLKAGRVTSAWEFYRKYKDTPLKATETAQNAPKPSADQTIAQSDKKQQKPNKATQTASSTGGGLSKIPKFVGIVKREEIAVRTWAGNNFGTIKSWPKLLRTNLVDVCDTLTGVDGKPWYYIRIAAKFYGFVEAGSIMRQ